MSYLLTLGIPAEQADNLDRIMAETIDAQHRAMLSKPMFGLSPSSRGEVVTPSDLRRYPANLWTVPPLAVSLALEGL